MGSDTYFEVKLAKSGIGRSHSQNLTLAGIGLVKFGRTVYLKDTPAIRGMLYKVVHLIHLTVKSGAMPPSKRERARQGVSREQRRAASAAAT